MCRSGERKYQLAATAATGIAAVSKDAIAASAEREKEDDPQNTASAVITIKQTCAAAIAVSTEREEKDDPENATSASAAVCVCSTST